MQGQTIKSLNGIDLEWFTIEAFTIQADLRKKLERALQAVIRRLKLFYFQFRQRKASILDLTRAVQSH